MKSTMNNRLKRPIGVLIALVLGLISQLANAQNPCDLDFIYAKQGTQLYVQNTTDNPLFISYYLWDFGDGSPARYQNPHESLEHVYAAPGTYNVCLTDSFCPGSMVCKLVTIDTTAAIVPGIKDTLIGDGLYTFNPEGIDSAAIQFIYWDFGDGFYAYEYSPTHGYEYSGLFTVCLAVIDTQNNLSQNCKELDVVVLNNCRAQFSTRTINGAVQFDNFSYGLDSATVFEWDFGDGNSSTEKSPLHAYATPGLYEVKLIVRGVCVDSITQHVIAPDTTNCYFTFTSTINNQRVRFDIVNNDTTLLPGNQYHFDFGDGNFAGSYGNPVENIYHDTGAYVVCVSMFAPSCGSFIYRCDTIRITSLVPICKADFDVYPWDYYANVVNKSQVFGTQNQYEVSINWGDGYTMPFTQDSIGYTHEYDSAGFYPITLTVMSIAGCSDSITKIVGVGPKYTLSGNVSAGGSAAPYVSVYIYAFEPISGQLSLYGATSTNDSGFYEINLPIGYYLVQADFLFDPTQTGFYLPTYYQNKLNWDLADLITLTSDRSSINIDLIPYSYYGSGYGTVSGMVMFGEGNKSQNGPITPGTPADKMLIYLLDGLGNPVAYTHTHNDGSFNFGYLPEGNYQLWAEMAGKVTEPALVSISETNNTVNDVRIVIGQNRITTSVAQRMASNTLSYSLYPNPGTDKVFLEAEGLDRAMVYDIMGKEITNLQQTVSANAIMLDIASLKAGVYLVQVVGKQGQTSTTRLMKQ
ncbi:MAG: PKD domain-containing protein [Bacteroidia bacterium]|jgi:PKD repeat protein|nr:PKD domain-containing protein [Bacteroidia bacterium]